MAALISLLLRSESRSDSSVKFLVTRSGTEGVDTNERHSMRTPIFVNVELGNADPEQKARFHQEMIRNQWTRCSDSCHSYLAEAEGGSCDEELIAVIEEGVTMAAERCGIYDWDGTTYLGG